MKEIECYENLERYNGLVQKEIVSNFPIHVQGFSIANKEVLCYNFKFFKLQRKNLRYNTKDP